MKKFFIETDITEIGANLKDLYQEFSGKRILITGGTGFLGRYFTQIFSFLNQNILKQPCQVISVDNLITSIEPKYEELSGIQFIQKDVTQSLQIEGKIDYILHAAGIASPYYYRKYPLQTLDVAIQGTRNMLDLAAQKMAKLLFFSSSEIYGDPDSKHVPTQESYRGNISCLGPRACYDESKRVGETLCQVYHTQFGTKVNIVRPFNVYGPGMQEKDYRVLPNFASRILSGKPIQIYGTGGQTRTFCYITDAIVGFLKILVRGIPGEPYNIGNPEPEIDMIGLAQTIEKLLKQSVKMDIVEYPDSYPADEPMRRCPDITKAFLQVGYEPKIELTEGLSRFFAWARLNYTSEKREHFQTRIDRNRPLGKEIHLDH